MDATDLRIGVLTAPSDPLGQASPLAGMQTERLAAALYARGCHLLSHELAVDATAPDAFRAAAAVGKQLSHRWRTTAVLPDVILCDGFLSAMAAFALAGRSGARVVLWLGSDALPRVSDQFRMAVAVTRSAAAVFTSSGELALRLRGSRISERVDVIPPAVDLDSVAEAPPWRLRQQAVPPGGGLVVSVTGTLEPGPDQRKILDLVHRALPRARTVTVTGAQVAGSLNGVDVAITGLLPDGGRSTLHSMARGAVVVSMPRLPDRDLIEHRASGLHVDNSRSLFNVLRELERDVFLREALAQGAVDKIRALHATDVVAEVLHQRLSTLVAPGGQAGPAMPPAPRADSGQLPAIGRNRPGEPGMSLVPPG